MSKYKSIEELRDDDNRKELEERLLQNCTRVELTLYVNYHKQISRKRMEKLIRLDATNILHESNQKPEKNQAVSIDIDESTFMEAREEAMKEMSEKERLNQCKHIFADWCHHPGRNREQEKCPFYHDQTKCRDFERDT
jgi:hypothetical protein